MHLLTTLLVSGLVSASTLPKARDSGNLAAYFLDNNPSGSSIISLKIDPDTGLLSSPLKTSTGGKGLAGLNAPATVGTPPTQVAADPLFGQDAVVVDEDYLFTVNSGSNTVAMFFIDKDNPWSPRLLNTAPSLGEFPMSVAYSSKLKMACVLNGGHLAGITCYSTNHSAGLTPLTPLIPFPLSTSFNQTTPPIGPPGTTADIAFNPSSTALFVTIKGRPPTPGSIITYPLSPSTNLPTAANAKVFQPSDILVDFSISFLGSDDRVLVTDPAAGAALISVSPAPAFSMSVLKKISIANQIATCWSTFSLRFNSAFLFDAGKPGIQVIDPATGDVSGVLSQDMSVAYGGSFDGMVLGVYLYTLRAGSGVGVVDVSGVGRGGGGREVGVFELGGRGLGSRADWIGMAVYGH